MFDKTTPPQISKLHKHLVKEHALYNGDIAQGYHKTAPNNDIEYKHCSSCWLVEDSSFFKVIQMFHAQSTLIKLKHNNKEVLVSVKFNKRKYLRRLIRHFPKSLPHISPF